MQIFLKALQDRNISEYIAKKFELGLLLKDEVVGFFNHPIPDKFLGQIGLIFPIRNLYKEIVSVYLKKPKNIIPKYDALPFEKNVLFGLEYSFPFIYKEGAILVEGPFDVMALMSEGIYNVCALLGTSINITQISILSRFTQKCYILFDGDDVGRLKSINVLNKLRSFDFNVKIITLPKDTDPDSFIKTYGKDKFKALFSS